MAAAGLYNIVTRMAPSQLRTALACYVLMRFFAVALETEQGGPGPTSPNRAGHGDEHWHANRRMGRPPPHQMCQMTLQRERAEAALGREKTGQENSSVLGTALSWMIPPTTVYLSPSATAGLAALPAVLMVYLLWTIHFGRSSGRALCQCWLVVVVIVYL